MKTTPASLTPAALLFVPPLLWAGLLLSALLLAGVGIALSPPAGGASPGPVTALLGLAGAAAILLMGWLSAQLTDRRLFPRILSAQDRLRVPDSGLALLALRLNLQLLSWALSDLLALLGTVAAFLGEPGYVVVGGWAASLVTLLLALPRRGAAAAQLARWRAALDAKNLCKSTECVAPPSD